MPVGGTISDHDTLEVILGSDWWDDVCVEDLVLLVMLVNLPGQVWDVDTGITLSGEEKIVWKSFWVENEELFESLEKIIGLTHVVLSKIFSTCTKRVSYTSWSLDVQHVGVMVP